MTPVDSVAQVLQRIAAQEGHSPGCDYTRDGRCDCDRTVRVAVRQAEAVLAALEDALDAASYNGAQRLEPGRRGYEHPTEAFVQVLAQYAKP